jgi:hypothetical protein
MNYDNKYLKYKRKYLNLINKYKAFKGGTFGIPTTINGTNAPVDFSIDFFRYFIKNNQKSVKINDSKDLTLLLGSNFSTEFLPEINNLIINSELFYFNYLDYILQNFPKINKLKIKFFNLENNGVLYTWHNYQNLVLIPGPGVQPQDIILPNTHLDTTIPNINPNPNPNPNPSLREMLYFNNTKIKELIIEGRDNDGYFDDNISILIFDPNPLQSPLTKITISKCCPYLMTKTNQPPGNFKNQLACVLINPVPLVPTYLRGTLNVNTPNDKNNDGSSNLIIPTIDRSIQNLPELTEIEFNDGFNNTIYIRDCPKLETIIIDNETYDNLIYLENLPNLKNLEINSKSPYKLQFENMPDFLDLTFNKENFN